MQVQIQTRGPHGGPKPMGTGNLEEHELECGKRLVVGAHYIINEETRQVLEVLHKGLVNWKYRIGDPVSLTEP